MPLRSSLGIRVLAGMSVLCLAPAVDSAAADEPAPAPIESQTTDSDWARIATLMHWLNLRTDFGARGDGRHDDTAAFRKALDHIAQLTSGAHVTLFIPEGTYRISGPLQCPPGVTLQGAGRQRTVLWLAENAPGFGDPSLPQTCLHIAGLTADETPQYFASCLSDVSIGLRNGNPGATALTIDGGANVGVRNMVLLAEGDSGHAGIVIEGHRTATAAFENLAVFGFDRALAASNRDASIVLHDCRFAGQRETGILNRGAAVSMELIRSDGPAPLIVNREGGLVSIISSDLLAGDEDAVGIDNEAVLYARNLKERGYLHTIRQTPPVDAPDELPGRTYKWGLLDEFVSVDSADAPERSALRLPIDRQPDVAAGDIDADWVSVTDFADRAVNGDWAPALQAAIDSDARTICIPQGCEMTLQSPVIIRGNIQRLFGAHQPIRWQSESEANSGGLVLDSSRNTVILERLTLPPLVHRSATTLIIRDCVLGPMAGEPGCGRLFVDNAVGTLQVTPAQTVWARHLVVPPWSDAVAMTNDGGQLWMLGLHADCKAQVLANRHGARTELLGGWIRSSPAGPASPLFHNLNGELSLTHTLATDSTNLQPYVTDEQDGRTETVTDYRWFARRIVQNLYRTPSRETPPAPAPRVETPHQ